MKIRRAWCFSSPPDDWADKIVIIWREDDSGCADRERLRAAFQRITGRRLEDRKVITGCDKGDWTASLFADGWVAIDSCEGSAIGVVADAD